MKLIKKWYKTLEEVAEKQKITRQWVWRRFNAGYIVKVGWEYFDNVELMHELIDAKKNLW